MLRPKDYQRGNIYLSGGMQFAKNLGAGWREICSAELKDMKYFPLDITELDVAYSKKYGELYLPSKEEGHIAYKSNIRKHFIYTDLSLIERDSDALIVYYDESARRGAGTISECQFAYNLQIPIFLVSDWKDINKEVPGWLQALATKIFTNFDDLHAYLKKLPDGIIKKDIYGNNRSGNKYLCHLCGSVFQKKKSIFVSKISPIYCKDCVNLVHHTHERLKDRYEFFMEYLDDNYNKVVVAEFDNLTVEKKRNSLKKPTISGIKRKAVKIKTAKVKAETKPQLKK